jgi:hypothetical protein
MPQVKDQERYDCSSLENIIYGASPMPEALLAPAMAKFPRARFMQGCDRTGSRALSGLVVVGYTAAVARRGVRAGLACAGASVVSEIPNQGRSEGLRRAALLTRVCTRERVRE